MAEYSPSFVPNLCACDVGLFCIYHVWDVYKFWNGLEWLFNGHDFVLWPFYDPLLANNTCVCALLHNLF